MGKTIGDLTAVTGATGADYVPIVRAGMTRRTDVASIRDFTLNPAALSPATGLSGADVVFLSQGGVAAYSTLADLQDFSLDFSGVAAETAVASGDQVLLYDDSASAVRRVTVANMAPVVFGTGGTLGATLNANGNAVDDVGRSYGRIVALADGATITPNFASGNLFSITLGGNRMMANPSNLIAGQSGLIFIAQDGTGSRTLAWGSAWKWAGGVAPTLSTGAGSIDVVSFTVMSGSAIIGTVPVSGAA